MNEGVEVPLSLFREVSVTTFARSLKKGRNRNRKVRINWGNSHKLSPGK